jgi:hypothetical protein
LQHLAYFIGGCLLQVFVKAWVYFVYHTSDKIFLHFIRTLSILTSPSIFSSFCLIDPRDMKMWYSSYCMITGFLLLFGTSMVFLLNLHHICSCLNAIHSAKLSFFINMLSLNLLKWKIGFILLSNYQHYSHMFAEYSGLINALLYSSSISFKPFSCFYL